MIREEAARQGADAKLALAIAGRESGFGQNNNSAKEARGIMQLIPSTAALYNVTDACDAAQNIRGGIAFMKDLHAEFGGNVMLMLAAYNAGQRSVYNAKGIPDFRETVKYVAAVSNAYYDFPNALQRGRKNTAAKASQGQQTGTASAQEIKPINDPNLANPSKTAANQWIGGQVLYVGDSNP
ncbi:lytic transglycosylase domain-containing protein [Labrys sp. 22185]|uniref:lytic transglycosylase domain-containing protein n=1 Tax=Labrys sp. 22185 TaxID=3453888 RepID=UPI003F84F0C3